MEFEWNIISFHEDALENIFYKHEIFSSGHRLSTLDINDKQVRRMIAVFRV